MIKEIKMPAGGQTTDTSTVGTWLVKKGDRVERGDALLEVETDKATLTVESYAKGIVLAILAEEGDIASAGDVIAYIGEESDRAEVEKRLSGKSQKDEKYEEDEYQPIDKSVPRAKPDIKMKKGNILDIKAMPNAKLMAKNAGVFLEDVAKYAEKNILKRQDVENYLAYEVEKKERKTIEITQQNTEEKVPLTTMRKIIAQRMTESAQSIPMFNASVEINMEQSIRFRKTVNDSGNNVKISYNDILFKCMEAAIRKYPYINASYTDDALILHKDVNIGLAVSVEGGLVVPVVKQVNAKNILEISCDNKTNVEKARQGKLSTDDMSGGTITLSNLGMYPVTNFQAIINPPEVCILAVGCMEKKPVFEEGEWKTAIVMNITGSFDHRVIDGAYAAQFLTALKKIIENPALALL